MALSFTSTLCAERKMPTYNSSGRSTFSCLTTWKGSPKRAADQMNVLPTRSSCMMVASVAVFGAVDIRRAEIGDRGAGHDAALAVRVRAGTHELHLCLHDEVALHAP